MFRSMFVAVGLVLVLATFVTASAEAQPQSDGLQNSRREQFSVFVPGSASTRIAVLSPLNPLVGPETAPIASLSARSASWSPLSNSLDHHEGRVMLASGTAADGNATRQPEIILRFVPRVGFRHVVMCMLVRSGDFEVEVLQGSRNIPGFDWQSEPRAVLLLAPSRSSDLVELHFRFAPGTYAGASLSLFGCEISSINV